MIDPFKSFRFEDRMCTGSIACPMWDNLLLRVFVPFGDQPRPVEHQIRITSQLVLPRESIRAKTEAAIVEAAEKLGIPTMSPAVAFSEPQVWIPPVHTVQSALDDVFVLLFNRPASNTFQAVALVNGWNVQNVEVTALD